MPPLARGREATAAFRRLAQAARPVLFLDLDGTLAPIVERPDAARVPWSTRRVLQALRAGGARIILVSGRPVAQVPRVIGTPVDAILGDHGSRLFADGRVRNWLAVDGRSLDRLARRIESDLAGLPGARLERKERSLAVHLRLPRSDGDRTARRIARLLRRQGFRVLRGHRILDAQLPGVNKGLAVRRWLARHPSPAVLYAGDDTTDDDAMRALGARATTIAVGPRPRHARFRTRDPGTFAAWLARLAQARVHR
jgi:trehalose 6-phosphate phosphatase